jgi:hypothetical protein
MRGMYKNGWALRAPKTCANSGPDPTTRFRRWPCTGQTCTGRSHRIMAECSCFVQVPPLPFAELSVTSNFTFLTGASHPEEMMRRAADLGLPAPAIADDHSVAGIMRAHVEAREIARRDGSAPRLIPAARIVTRNRLTEVGSGRAAVAPFPGQVLPLPALLHACGLSNRVAVPERRGQPGQKPPLRFGRWHQPRPPATAKPAGQNDKRRPSATSTV